MKIVVTDPNLAPLRAELAAGCRSAPR